MNTLIETLMKALGPSFALLLLSACTGERQVLSIEQPWIRAAPPGATAMAAYADLHNNGRSVLHCTAADSPDFGAVEIHRSVVENGVSRMVKIDTLEIPAGGKGELKPGSYHLMLFRPARQLQVGDSARITIHCRDAQQVEHPVSATFEVHSAS